MFWVASAIIRIKKTLYLINLNGIEESLEVQPQEIRDRNHSGFFGRLALGEDKPAEETQNRRTRKGWRSNSRNAAPGRRIHALCRVDGVVQARAG